MWNRNRRGVPFARHAATVAALVASSLFVSPAVAKQTMQLLVQPGEGQAANMLHGVEMVVSQGQTSELRLLTPEPTEDGRIRIVFLFVNRSNAPVNIGPENVTATTLSVIPYDKLMEEQKHHEGRRRFGNFLASLATGLSAASAGNEYGSYSYSGYSNRGGFISGGGTVSVYNPYLAQQAAAEAGVQNEVRTERMYQSFAAERSNLRSNLRTTTVLPNQQLQSVITLDIPRSARKASSYLPFTIAVQIGGDRHVLNGFVGRAGTLPMIAPSPTMVASASSSARPYAPTSASSAPRSYTQAPRIQPAPAITRAALVKPVSVPAGAVSTEAYRRGEYAGQPEQIAAVAKLGFAPAQNELGTMYQLGREVPQNDAEAVRLFKLAAMQGYRDAFTNLAWMYEKGRGVPKNLEIAAHYYNIAAKQGDELASDHLRELQLGG